MDIMVFEIAMECPCWHCKGRGYQWPPDDEPDETKRTECGVCRGNKVIPTALGVAVLRLIEHNPNGLADVWPGKAEPVEPPLAAR